MRRLALLGLFVVYSGVIALGLYEITAKSPQLLGTPLPGWESTCSVEKTTPWRPGTGILPVDKLLHETQEACLYYGLFGAN